jgi:hypothetical protein
LLHPVDDLVAPFQDSVHVVPPELLAGMIS